MGERKNVHILGGGTIFHVRSHLALCAPAFGTTAKTLTNLCQEQFKEMDVITHLTRMADPNSDIETNEDVEELLDTLVTDPATKVIFMNVALCDYQGSVGDCTSSKYATRLKSRDGFQTMSLYPADKLIAKIRAKRKDIFLVGFKTTNGASADEQYWAGLTLCKEASCNLVLANDVKYRRNMIITPEEARYHTTSDRAEALTNLVEMTWLRSHLTFTRSTVIDGERIPWNSSEIPKTLRQVVNFCIEENAYKPFRGATVGHFACKVSPNKFLTSIRKTNFNELEKNGLVKIKTDGPDTVLAYGAKPSVGGQSQRIVFQEHPEYDCIVHFHCPRKPFSEVPVVSQREYECGSHQCGQNTSNGLKKFGNLSAVYLDHHGPNIVFHRSIDPNVVINFIKANFDLSQKTGGYIQLGGVLEGR